MGQILLVVMESLTDAPTTVLSLEVISQMLTVQPQGFLEFLEIVVSRLFECFKSPSLDVSLFPHVRHVPAVAH